MMRLFGLINTLYLVFLENKVKGGFFRRLIKYRILKILWRLAIFGKAKHLIFSRYSKDSMSLSELLLDYSIFLENVAILLGKSIKAVNFFDNLLMIKICQDKTKTLRVVKKVEYVVVLSPTETVGLYVTLMEDGTVRMFITTSKICFEYSEEYTDQQYILVQNSLDKTIRKLIYYNVEKIIEEIYKIF